MKTRCRKSATLTVEISYPSWMTLAQAKREIRTLVSNGTNFLSCGPDYQDVEPGTVKLRIMR